MALIKHRKEWSIGKQRVGLDVAGMVVSVRIDGASEPVLTIGSKLLGVWPFEVGPRTVELRRVRTLDVARSELWIDGIKVPPTREPLEWKKAKDGAHCEAHRAGSTYREPGLAPLAKIECGNCGQAICAEHRAVDGVRCIDCFARAAEQLQRDERNARRTGVLLSLAIVVAIAAFGVVTNSPKAILCAVGATLVGLFSGVRGLLKERGVIRERQA